MNKSNKVFGQNRFATYHNNANKNDKRKEQRKTFSQNCTVERKQHTHMCPI